MYVVAKNFILLMLTSSAFPCSDAAYRDSQALFLYQECIVVCVVSLEELKITPGNVPYEQCREIRTEGAMGKVYLLLANYHLVI